MPTISDPGEIGMALYDAGTVGDAVVSLLTLLHVGIYDAAGNAVVPGNERAAGDPWLTDREVWGLIDMGITDITTAGDSGARYRLKDLYDPLAESLGGLSLTQFVAAYRDSYAAHPDDLAPLAMIGQPIDETTPLTRTQIWLLYMDGFVDLAPPVTAGLTTGALLAVGGPTFGTANVALPMLLQPNGMAAADWLEIIPRLPLIAYDIDFQVSTPNVHEGHGSEGQPVTVDASVAPGQVIWSRRTSQPRHIILQPNPGSLAGLDVEWGTGSQASIDAHGHLDASLPAHIATDTSGRSSVIFTPRKEKADGHGFIANELASLYARVKLTDLLRTAYLIDNTTFARILGLGSLGGTLSVNGGIDVEFHSEGIFVSLSDAYDALVDLSGAMGPVVASAYRKGVDTAEGVLILHDDGNWYGTLHAKATTKKSNYEFVGVLAGRGVCADTVDTVSSQDLYVVGVPSGRTFRGTDEILPNPDGTIGQPATHGLDLKFFPVSTARGRFGCQSALPVDWASAGLAVGAPALANYYIPLNDSRWNTPTIGYGIVLPFEGQINYKDKSQAKTVTNIPTIDSVWTIKVDTEPPPP